MKTKKVLTIVLVTVLLVGAMHQPAQAQVSFLFGMAMGATLFGGDTINGGSSAAIIYTLPYASERVKKPLSIQFISTRPLYFSGIGDRAHDGKGLSLHALFKKVEPNAEGFEILQVVRAFDPSSPDRAAFWFAYIPKHLILPPPKPINEKK